MTPDHRVRHEAGQYPDRSASTTRSTTASVAAMTAGQFRRGRPRGDEEQHGRERDERQDLVHSSTSLARLAADANPRGAKRFDRSGPVQREFRPVALSSGMRHLLICLGLAASLAAVPEAGAQDEAAGDGCLSSGDAQEAVTTQQIVKPGRAIVLARRAVPNADVLRAALCRDAEVLVYRIMILRRDGRLVRVTVDAPTGTVKSVY